MTDRFQPQDQDVRLRAMTVHDRVFTIEAGAGTGKTSLLTGKYLDLVQRELARPTEIVAITFTEKAAGDLKERVRKVLTKAEAKEALRDLDRSPISTIHAFAASLLHERPLEVGLDPNFQTLDAVSQKLFLRRCYEEWLPRALAENRTVASRALGGGWSLARLREIAFALYAHRDLYPGLSLDVPPLPFDELFHSLAEKIISLWTFAEKECVDVRDEGYRAIEKLHAEVSHLRGAPRELKERALLTRLQAPLKGKQGHWANAESGREQKARMKEIKADLDTLQQNVRTALFQDVLLWLGSFLPFVENEKRVSGIVDFDDLLLLARDLLKNHETVRTYFRKRYRIFLVDEFQDTDPIQTELVWLLCAENMASASWKEWPLEPGRLFLVGDPKQSIYRFRRADIDVYDAAAQEVSRQGERLVIHQNFRSSPPLVEWINATFEPILEQTYSPLTADPRHVTPPDVKPVAFLSPPEDLEELSIRDVRLREADALAGYLRQLLDNAETVVFDRDQRELRPVRPGDIAVLFPATTDIDLYEEALRRYDLPFSLEGGHLFFGRAEIHSVLSALEAIDRPTDPVVVVAALRSVLFGCSDQDLVMIRSMKCGFDYRTIDPDAFPEPVRTAFHVLRNLHDIRHLLTPSQLIARLLEKTAAVPITLARRHGEQAAANLEKFIALAHSLERIHALTVGGFIRWARDRIGEADKQAESPLSTGDKDHLRLLTIHKAKGLEFPIVALANLSSGSSRTENVVADRLHRRMAVGFGSKDQRFATPDFEAMTESENVKRSLELQRLLYVAATRASDQLILPCFISKKRKSPYWDVLDPNRVQASPLVDVISYDSIPLREEIGEVSPAKPKTKPGRTLDAQEKKLEKSFAERVRLIIAGLPLRKATDLVHDKESRTPMTPHPAAAAGMAVGLALHQVLERIDIRSPELVAALSRQAAHDVNRPDLAEEIETLARTSLDSPIFGRVRRATRVFRELPFSWSTKIENAPALFEGVIDLLFEEPDGLVIVDYKTDRVTKGDLEERTEHYRPQLALYADAVEKLIAKRVKETLLFFVRPGEIVSVKRNVDRG